MADTVPQIFIVVAVSNPVAVSAKIAELKLKAFNLKSDTWFVVSEGTTQEVAEKLGVRSGAAGTGIVCPITAYSGRAPSQLWEWFNVYWPKNG